MRKRLPEIGTLRPYETRRLEISPPIDPTTRPVVISAHGGDIVVRSVMADYVELENKGGRPVPFVLILAPDALVDAALIPWGYLFRTAKNAIKSLKKG